MVVKLKIFNVLVATFDSAKQSKDVQQVRVIKSKTGEMLMEKEKVKQRSKEYFDNLLNQENPTERREMRTEERK